MKFYFVLLVLALSACQSKSVSSKAASLTGYPQNLGAAPLITGGQNRSAVFSLDGSKIFFVSKGRRDHRNSQAYQYDLSTSSDRRVTFQDGEVLSVGAAPDNKIFYSSNTDEIKERPFIKDAQAPYPRSEIYHSDLFGDQIVRVTEAPGFDGEMIYVEPLKSLLFTSARSGIAGLYLITPTDAEPVPLVVGKSPARAPALSADSKQLYWVEEDPTNSRSQSIVKSSLNGKDRVVVRTVPGAIKGLAVNALGLVAYAWQARGSEFVQIDLYTPESNCNRTLLKSKMDFSEPHFSRKHPQVLLFRGALLENSVIYRWELPEALGPCVR